MGSVKHYKDGHRHCVQIERKGKAPEINVYVDRRCGLTFPTTHNHGYFCLFGLKDMPSMSDRLPMQLLVEEYSESADKLFLKLVAAMRKYNCSHVYADCSKEFQSSEVQLAKFLQRRNVRFMELFDASDFEGFDSTYAGFEAARAPVDEYGRRGKLLIPPSGQSRLGTELNSYMEEHLSGHPERQFPAINAFNHVVLSYVLSPYERPGAESQPDIGEGYGG